VAPVIATTRAMVGDLATSADLVPFEADRAALYRAELQEKAPRVAQLAHEVSRGFARRTMAMVVPSLGLERQPLEAQRTVLFALAHLLGTPTATEPRHRRVLWDVKARA